MAYRLMIVDDEETARQGMFEGVDWAKLGFEAAAQAENGVQALDLMREQAFDVVLTDIRMDEMDGMELISRIAYQYPDVRVVLVSGYSEIEYYQKALQYKIFDYISKPTCLEDFSRVFGRLKQTLDEQRGRQLHLIQMQSRLQESQSLARQRLLPDLLNGNFLDEDSVLHQLEQCGVKSNLSRFRVVRACCIPAFGQPSFGKEQLHLVAKYLQGSLRALLSPVMPCLAGVGKEGEAMALTMPKHDRDLENLLRQLASDVAVSGEVCAFFGVSEAGSGAVQLTLCAEQAGIAMNQVTFSPEREIVFYEQISMDQPAAPTVDEQKLAKEVLFETREIWNTGVEELFRRFRGILIREPDRLDRECLSLYEEVTRHAQQLDIPCRESKALRKTLEALRSMDEKKAAFKQELQKIRGLALEARQGSASQTVRQIETLLEQNFCDSQFSLAFLSEKVGRSIPYLSTVYKQKTGHTINDALMNLRIERAKHLLLSTTLKTYRVAEAVGYLDGSYFTKIFRRYTGCSPVEYRNMRSGETGDGNV